MTVHLFFVSIFPHIIFRLTLLGVTLGEFQFHGMFLLGGPGGRKSKKIVEPVLRRIKAVNPALKADCQPGAGLVNGCRNVERRAIITDQLGKSRYAILLSANFPPECVFPRSIVL